jgi:DNA gyrase subunit B
MSEEFTEKQQNEKLKILSEADNYTAKNIIVSVFPACVQNSPGMYIGNVNGNEQGDGINHMAIEIISNSVDECMAGYANEIHVILTREGYVTVEDNGRGMPVDMLIYKDDSGHEITKSGVETIFTVLHAGAKSTGNDNGYKVSGGRHGVGASVVNALSAHLKVEIFRGYRYEMEFQNGLVTKVLTQKEKTIKRGTLVSFKPSDKIFTIPIINPKVIENNLEELSFLNSKIKIYFNDEVNNVNKIFYSPNGLLDFMKKILSNKKTVIDPILFKQESTTEDTFECEIGMVWCQDYEDEECFAYTNNIHQPDYGYHVTGFRFGLMRGITNYIDKNKNRDYISMFLKKNIEITSEDVRGSMKNIINVKCSSPMFSSQTKTKLVSIEVKVKVEKLMEDQFRTYLEKNPEITKKILLKIFSNALARNIAKKEREKDLIINDVNSFSIPGKLTDCDKRIPPSERELIMVEGNSAAGTAKQARGLFQAILAMKGKPTNAMKIDKLKVLATEAFTIILGVLGLTFKDFEEDDISYLNKLRYHKIILMADADVDGSHIKALILSFFYKYLPLLIKNGHIYVALPPLYGIKSGGKITYVKDEEEFKKFIGKRFYEEYIFIPDSRKDEILSIDEINNLTLMIEEYKNIIHSKWKGDLNIIIYSYLIMLLTLNKNKDFQEIQNKFNDQYTTFKLFDENEEFYKVTENTQYGLNIYEINKKLPELNENLLKLMPLKIINKKNNIEKNYINPLEVLNFINNLMNRIDIQRFKGLGEMNADQLEETAINPKTRNIVQITLQDIDIYSTSKIINDLMTLEGVDIRKKLIIDGINSKFLIDV